MSMKSMLVWVLAALAAGVSNAAVVTARASIDDVLFSFFDNDGDGIQSKIGPFMVGNHISDGWRHTVESFITLPDDDDSTLDFIGSNLLSHVPVSISGGNSYGLGQAMASETMVSTDFRIDNSELGVEREYNLFARSFMSFLLAPGETLNISGILAVSAAKNEFTNISLSDVWASADIYVYQANGSDSSGFIVRSDELFSSGPSFGFGDHNARLPVSYSIANSSNEFVRYGLSFGSGAGGTVVLAAPNGAVPEPASLALVLTAALVGGRAVRRRSSGRLIAQAATA